MWRKPEPSESSREDTPTPTTATPNPRTNPATSSPSGERAVIGASITIQGDVTGEEDLLIQGKVDGKVNLKQNNVTIGERGRVKADVYGRGLVVEGEVEGNLYGDERVIVRQSGKVIGNITSPRVTLEDGATFKGSIDMDSKSARRNTAPTQTPSGGGEARPKAAAGGGA